MEFAVNAAVWVVGKALSPLSDGLLEAWAASSELGPNIRAVKIQLLYAQGMLDNARGREIRSPALKELLQELRRLAYNADDVLDELDYFRIQDELEGTYKVADRGCLYDLVRDAGHMTRAVGKQLHISPCSSAAHGGNPYRPEEGTRRWGICGAWPCKAPWKKTPKLDFDRVGLSRRMKDIVEQLQPLCAKVSTILGLELLGSGHGIRNGTSTSRPITTSGSTKTELGICELFGRDTEKNSILEDITKGEYFQKDITTLPIVGPGGIGKTTLTQYIYNSPEVQEHFQIRVWICVSRDFSVYRLTREIAECIPKAEDEKNSTDGEPKNLDQIQKLIEKRLKNKRFLLVLDDIWKYDDEYEWERLLLPFTKGQVKGNIVLVSTRFLEVAEMVRTANKVVHLDGLNPAEFWSFFLSCVFCKTTQQSEGSDDLLRIGKQIVKKLKGSPLAAQTVGRLLRNNLTPDLWTRVLESKEWESQTGYHDIMPALKLSYDYLWVPLQQCFAYCALFPKDYKFDREELIRFWIELDILCPDHPSKRIEDTGLDYLNDLVNYGFFKKDIYEQDTYYIFHGLLHDLALKVSPQECLSIDSSRARPIDIPSSICHLSINMSNVSNEDGTFKENFRRELGKIGNGLTSESRLHTLMLFGEYDATFVRIFSYLFKDAKFLRVVHLSRMSYPVESILPNFSKLVHLRYLRLGSTYGSKIHLPSSLSRFYHLRVLDMRGWHGAWYLPGDLSNLVNLRHFIVSNDADELHSNISNVEPPSHPPSSFSGAKRKHISDSDVSAARWVVGKALGPVTDGLLEAWAASAGLRPNLDLLKMELLYAQGMLNKAQGRDVRKTRNPALKELLYRLRLLAYDADDVLDELDYFRIQDELDGTYRARDAVHAAGKHFPCYSFPSVHDDAHTGTLESSNVQVNGRRFLCGAWTSKARQRDRAVQTPKLDLDRVGLSRRMKYIVEQLQPVCAKVSTILDLELLGSGHSIDNATSTSRSITTSGSTEAKLFGRDYEMNSIIEDITKGEYFQKDLTILPIVGPGGIGKTTLTQYIYNSSKAQEHFQVRVWICVSLDFSVYRLTQEIAESIPKAEDEKNSTDGEPNNLDQLQKLIEKRLKNKRFLLVLDDIWKYGDEYEWKRLLLPFTKGQVKGNIVLVSTRLLEVAEMVRTTNKVIQLGGLKPTDFWSFFMACVFGETMQPSECSDLLCIGKQIVEKLKGSPLAAKTVGRLLRNDLTPDHWTRVLESTEWESQTGDHDIMPALKLSYDYLSFPLQQCFAYCALFPKDYKFDGEELIRFWIGLDILCPGHPSKRIEDTGLDYLNDLVNYGFFKKETDEQDTYYIIHDLLHDLALKLSSQECLIIDSSRARHIDIAPSIRHLSINMSSEDGTFEENLRRELGKIGNRLKSESLHTLMLFGEYGATFVGTFSNLFKDTKFLRVVHLSRMSYPVESILPNFSKLVHLRYLRLGSTCGTEIHLPSSLSRFYHLRILDMRGWRGARNLPGDLSNLVKLRHFIVPNDADELHFNISNVGKQHCLQELRRFQVKKENGFELRELGQLAELGGSLSIYNIEHVQVNEAGEAKLLFKNRLHKLTLNWDKGRSNKDPDKEDKVLENLRPHSNIRELCIDGHGGPTCPTWLGTNLSVKGLEALRLDGVAWKTLPPLGELCLIDESGKECFGCITGGHFQHLKRLELVSLPNLKKWVAKEACPMLFCTIEVLIVGDCSELVELPFSHYTCYPSEGDGKVTWFPNLRELQVCNCPNVSVPPIPWTGTLCSVKIRNVGSSLLDELTYSKSSSEVKLEISGKDDLHSLDEVLIFKSLTELQELEVSKCPPMELKHLPMLTSLKTLRVNDSNNVLGSLGDVEWQLPIERLLITRCTANGKELTQLLSHLPKLSLLCILSCQKIARLGVVVEQQQTTAPVSSPSSSAVKLEDTQATDEQQQITEELEEEKAVVEPVEKEEDGLLLFPAHLSNSLRVLMIGFCEELSLVAGGGDLQALRSLQRLNIMSCPKFLSDYNTSSCCPFPSSLQSLHLSGVEGVKTLEPLSNLTSLQSLDLYGVEGVKTLEPLSNLTSLQSLDLSGVEGVKTLEPLSNLTSLTRLVINDRGEDLRGEGLWPLLTQGQLSELEVTGSPNFFAGSDLMRGLQEEEQRPLRPSSKLRELVTSDIAGLLVAPICTFLSSSLTNLDFTSNKGVERFTKEQEDALPLLTSLQVLQFSFCDKLERLPIGLHGLANLKILRIYGCPAIRSLPKGGLPSSLQELHVRRCDNEELKQRCRKLMGTIPEISL